MTAPKNLLTGLLDLKPEGEDHFSALHVEPCRKRIFGGQLLAQSLLAASKSVEGKPAHALHANFLLPGDPSKPLIFRVERLREGHNFASRQVRVTQLNRLIFIMLASFHRESSGPEYLPTMPKVADPESLPCLQGGDHPLLEEVSELTKAYWQRERPFDIRPIDPEVYLARQGDWQLPAFWFKSLDTLPEDPQIHQSALTYISDAFPLDTILHHHSLSVLDPDLQVASLDHTLHFHEEVNVNEWLLYSSDRRQSTKARGLAQASIFTASGRLIASVSQEGLMRFRRKMNN